MFWMLAGYCLRPGFGAPLDDRRVSQLVPLFESGVMSGASARTWQQFWIAWRRIVAGLHENTQLRVFGLLEPFFAPSELKLKRSKSLKAAEPSHELLELLASLERLPAEQRSALGDWLIERTFRGCGARSVASARVCRVTPARITWCRRAWSKRGSTICCASAGRRCRPPRTPRPSSHA